MTHLADFEYIHPFQRYSPSKFEVDRNRANFSCFSTLIFFWEPSQNFGRDYKSEHASEQRGEFRGDRPTELGDLARGK